MSKLIEVCLGNLWTQRFTFARMGLNLQPSAKEGVLKSPVLYTIMVLSTGFELCTVCAFMVKHRNQIVLCSEALMHGLQMISSLLKMAIFLAKSRDLVALIRMVQAPFNDDNVLGYKEWCSQNRRGQLMAAVYFGMCAGTSVFFFCCSTTAVDTLYGWCALGLSSQYHRLGRQLKLLFDGHSNPSRFDLGLSELFTEHARLLRLVEHFNASFMEIAFVEVLVICVLYCSVICQYIMPHTNQNFAFLGFFSMVVTTQLCIYLFGAEQVRLEAEGFAGLLYQELPWQKLSPSHRRLLLFPLQRAQRETILGAYFFELGRPLLVWVSLGLQFVI